jgi:hypothetical protein
VPAFFFLDDFFSSTQDLVAVANCLRTACPGIPPVPYRQLLFTSIVSVAMLAWEKGSAIVTAAEVPAAAARGMLDSLQLVGKSSQIMGSRFLGVPEEH